jgi:hypothetical protein
MQMDDLKVCYKCKTAKERTEFYKRSASDDGLQYDCKSCKKAHRKDYYEANTDKVNACNRAWHEAHPDRFAAIKGKSLAVERGGSVSDIYDVELCLPFYAESRRLSSETGSMYNVDHIIPLAKGGLHCQTNLQVLTAIENKQKGNSL